MKQIVPALFAGTLLLFSLALLPLSSQTHPPQPQTLPLKCAEGDCPLLQGIPQTAGMRSGFVRLKPGGEVGWHTTGQNEEALVVLRGRGEARIEGQPGRAIEAPMHVYIPPATRHNVANTGGEPLEYVYVVSGCNGTAAPEGADGISRLTRPLVLDGKMGDRGWKLATRYADFKMRHPEAGQSPSERTEVYLAYDAATLYVAIRSFDDEPKKIRAAAATGDDAWKDDWAVLCLNPFDDALNSLFFLVTPGNIRSSGALDNDNKPQLTVNMNWESRASIVNDGWIAEMAIPLRSLSFQGSDRVTMSFKVARFISRKAEEENLPEMNPERREYDHYREIVLRDVVPSSVSASEVYEQGLENLRRTRIQLHDLGYEEQLQKWGDASVLDYLIFRSRELKASPHPFHFQRAPEDERVAALLGAMEHAPGKRVGNLERFLTRSATTSFLVIRDDALIYEHYFNGYRGDSIVTSFSVAKSFDSILVGIAIDEGKIGSVRDPITKYLPELAKRDPRFAQITIRGLLMMSSGIRYNEDPPFRDNDVTYHATDLRRAALEKTAIVEAPGKHWLYNNYHPLLLGMILERVTGMSVTAYLQEKLWEPLGMEYPGSWSINGDQD